MALPLVWLGIAACEAPKLGPKVGMPRPDAGTPTEFDAGQRPGCRPPPVTADAGDDAGVDDEDGGTGAQPDTAADSRTRLESAADFAELATPAGEVKFLVPVPGRDAPVPLDARCTFQNTRRHPFHLGFIQSLDVYVGLDLSSYQRIVESKSDRVFWAGTLRLWPGAAHPQSGALGVLSFTLYTGSTPEELPDAQELAEVARALSECTPFAPGTLAFLPDGLPQEGAVLEQADELAALDVAVLEPARLARALLGAQIYSAGESYGVLRIAQAGQPLEDVSPRDILVSDTAPNELTTVAGLLTSQPQSEGSHLNVRLRERGVPSAALSGIDGNAALRALADGLVHLVVDGDAQTIEVTPATADDAESFWRGRRVALPSLQSDLSHEQLRAFAAMRAPDAAIYGAKAANLGELYRALPPEHRVEGFGIPFAAYTRFMRHSSLELVVERMLDEARVFEDAALRKTRLADLRSMIRDAELPPGMFEELLARATLTFGSDVTRLPLRFRSSTNAEDLPGLSGAGLYDSRTGCFADDLDGDTEGPSRCLSEARARELLAELERRRAELAQNPGRAWLPAIIADLEDDLIEEKTVARALRRVWSSLWTDRAFEDRQWRGIDHRGVFMGIAVNAAFVGERINAVAFTELDGGGGRPLYRLVSQLGEESVVDPEDPGALPEVLTFRRSVGDRVMDVMQLAGSSRASAGAALWSTEQLDALGPLLFAVQRHFEREVYCGQPAPSLDIELKLDANGVIVLKQVRPYRPE